MDLSNNTLQSFKINMQKPVEKVKNEKLLKMDEMTDYDLKP